MSVTIVEIAKRLDLSASTVSRVLNNSSLIGEETSRKIHAMAESMGYKPRIIKRHQTRAVLTIKFVISPKNDNNMPLFYDISDLIYGIKEGVDFAKLNLAIEINDEKLNLFEHKKSGQIDGVIFAFTKPTETVYDQLDAKKIPHLTLNREIKSRDFISYDNEKGMAELLSKVYLKNKHMKPIFVTTDVKKEIPSARLNGLHLFCAEKKIAFHQKNDVRNILRTDEINEDFFNHLKSMHYNTIVCMNDVIASAILTRARYYHIEIPKEFALTGFDNSPLQQLYPQKINTISLPIKEFGQKAGEWIDEKIISKSQNLFQYKLTGQYSAGQTI